MNTKKRARKIYEGLKGSNSYYLTTNLYPEHRKRVLAEIRQRLAQGESCQVVSTSLIEAGVDADFPCVYRELTGIDSIIQAAGRCNREGKRPAASSIVYIFELSDTGNNKNMYNAQELETGRMVLNKYADLSGVEAVADYFKSLYSFKGETLDSKKILENANLKKLAFADVASAFKLIPNMTKPIFIPISDEAKAIEIRLRNGERSIGLLRRMGRYVVDVYEKSYDELFNTARIDCLEAEGNINILHDTSIYDENMGLIIDIEAGEGIML